MAIISGEHLAHALAGMSFPARQWQAVAWADFNCASAQVREVLRHMPDRNYGSAEEILVTLAAIEQRAATLPGSVVPSSPMSGP